MYIEIQHFVEGTIFILNDLGTLVEFFFKDFIYLFMRDIEREREAETQAEREAGSMHREPDVGFDPRSPGSHPGPKADAKPLHHPGIPEGDNLFFIFFIYL